MTCKGEDVELHKLVQSGPSGTLKSHREGGGGIVLTTEWGGRVGGGTPT